MQSLSPSVCQEIGRKPEKTLQGLRELQRNSINCEVSLIYGLPKQNFQDFEQDIRQLKEMGISKISAFPLQIYPGTKFFQEQEKLPLRFKPNTLGILEVDQTQDFQRMKALAEKNDKLSKKHPATMIVAGRNEGWTLIPGSRLSRPVRHPLPPVGAVPPSHCGKPRTL